MRRTLAACVVVALCGIAAGCSAIDQVLNPMPTGGGTRVTEKLRSLPPPDPTKEKKVVTVYKFENKTGFPHGLALSNGMTEQLITALVETQRFRVVDRAALNQIMTEKNLQRSGEATGDAGKTKLIGAALIIAGAVTELSETGGMGVNLDRTIDVGLRVVTAEVALDMRITDAGTGEILASVPVRKTIRDTGISAGHSWGLSGDVKISNALDRAVRETLEEAVYQIVTRYGL